MKKKIKTDLTQSFKELIQLRKRKLANIMSEWILDIIDQRYLSEEIHILSLKEQVKKLSDKLYDKLKKTGFY